MVIVKDKIKNFFKINGDYKIAKYSLLAIFVVGIIAHYLVIINGFTNPDGINEGFYYYSAADWASSGCGRWLIRYFNALQGNVVIPILSFIEYCLFTWFEIILIIKILDIRKMLFVITTSALFIVLPGVMTQMVYIYTAACYCLAGLLAVLFVYFNLKDNKLYSVLSSLCLALSMGLYQSYIGMAAALFVMVLVINYLKDEDLRKLIITAIKSIISAILGAIIYFVLYKLDMKIFGLTSAERVNAFSLKEIINNLPTKFIEMYSVYINNFYDGILKRNYLYLLLAVLFVIFLIICVCQLLKNRKYSSVIVLVLGVSLLPPLSNIIGILIPYNNVNLMMSTQNYLLVPFGFSLFEIFEVKLTRYISYVSCLLLLFISWTYVISANATYRCYILSYNHINTEVSMVLQDVYKLDGYVKDETPIVFGGFPDDKQLRDELPLYNYTIELYPNVIFWQDMSGVINNRYNYLLNCFGINAGNITEQEYYDLMTSEEYKEMGIWPSKNSVKIINGIVVVKYTDDPLLPG